MRQSKDQVKGLDLDAQTRCLHYRGPTDIIAIKMRCCETWYACIDCHAALAGHSAMVWPRSEWHRLAVRCGVCAATLTVTEYLESGNRCPGCGSGFNPGCRNHYHLYFETLPVSR